MCSQTNTGRHDPRGAEQTAKLAHANEQLEKEIDERRKAETALVQAKEDWERIFDSTPDLIALLDDQHRIVRINSAMARALGVAPEQCIGLSCFGCVHGTDRPPSFCPHACTLADGREHMAELHEDRLGGDFLVTTTPMYDAAGKLIGSVHVARDITERKRMERELRRSHEQLEELVRTRTAELLQINEQLKKENDERVRTEQSLRLEGARLDALLRLSQISESPIDEMASLVLERGIALTQSKIGFVGFLSEDEAVYTLHAVSKDVMKECRVVGDPMQWEVARAGLWADAIRQRKTLFIDDYSKPHATKKGLPPGHPRVERLMVVPVFENERIVAVAGVGNKASPYDRSDERQIVLLLGWMWNYVERNRSQEALQKAHDELEQRVEQRTAQLAASTEALQAEIAERKQAQARITELARFPEENPNPVLRASADGSLLYANDAARSMLEAMGWHSGERLPAVLREHVSHTISSGILTEVDIEAGQRVYSVALSAGAGHTDVNVYVRDVTDRKIAERALRTSRADLNRAQAVAHTGSWRLDVRHNELLWSDENHRIFGIPPGTPMTYETFLDTVHTDDRDEVHRQWSAALKGEPYDIEHRIVVDGQVKWVRERAELEFDDNGALKGGFGTTQDITEKKYVQQALQELNETLEQHVAQRTAAIQSLHDVASMANLAQDVEEALEYCLRRVAEHTGWDFGHAFLPADDDPDTLLPTYVWYSADAEQRFDLFRELTLATTLRRGHGLAGRVYDSGKSEWSTDVRATLGAQRIGLAKDLGIATVAAFPITVQQRVVGVLEFFSDKVVEPSEPVRKAMISVGTQMGRVIERKAFQDRLLTLAEEEHRRIGQELHDDVGQEMTGLALKMETLAEALSQRDDPTHELAQKIVGAVDRTRRKCRTLSRGLMPAETTPAELGPSLDDLAAQTRENYGVACRFQCSGCGPVADNQTATQFYRIAREAVNNVINHAQAQNIEITLAVEPVEIVLTIRDDGIGMPHETQPGPGMGLRIMRHRAELIGGRFEIDSSPAGGTAIICRLPRKTAIGMDETICSLCPARHCRRPEMEQGIEGGAVE